MNRLINCFKLENGLNGIETSENSSESFWTSWLRRTSCTNEKSRRRFCVVRHFALILLLIFYICIGAVIFEAIERKNWENERSIALSQSAKMHRIFVETLVGIQRDCKNHSKLAATRNSVMSAEKSCLNAFDAAVTAYEFQRGLNSNESKYNWDYWTSLFYSVTIVTTIGYGNVSCRTLAGRLFTIFYALIGIPLVMTVLGDLGKLMFKYGRFWWWKVSTKINFCIQRRRGTHPLPLPLPIINRNHSIQSMRTFQLDPASAFPLWLAISLLFLYILCCAASFMLWEPDWDFGTSIYFFFISFTTIGLGDCIPSDPKHTVLGFVYIIIGLALISMCIGVIQFRIQGGIYRAMDRLETQLIWNALHDAEFADEDPETQRKVSRILQRRLSRISRIREDFIGSTATLGILRLPSNSSEGSAHAPLSAPPGFDCNGTHRHEAIRHLGCSKTIFSLDSDSINMIHPVLPPFGTPTTLRRPISALSNTPSTISRISCLSTDQNERHCKENSHLKNFGHDLSQSGVSIKIEEWHPTESTIEEDDENQITLSVSAGAEMLNAVRKGHSEGNRSHSAPDFD